MLGVSINLGLCDRKRRSPRAEKRVCTFRVEKLRRGKRMRKRKRKRDLEGRTDGQCH